MAQVNKKVIYTIFTIGPDITFFFYKYLSSLINPIKLENQIVLGYND